MNKSTYLFLILFYSFSVFSQEERTTLYGTIKSEGAELQNIHILNKNSKNGTITNADGKFSIEAKKQDTLIVTGVQFYYIEKVISDDNIKTKSISIDLIQKMNELDEVEVTHNLTGNMSVDSDDIKITKNIEEGVLDFSEIDLNLVGVKIDESSRSRTSNDSELMPNMNPNLIAIAALILEPVVNGISKIGQTKRNIKKYERRYENKVLKAPKKIRIDFGDAFFTETLKIPANHIDEFIAHCLPKGIANLYVDNKKIEIIDVFLKESEVYLEQIKNEN